MFQVPQRSPSGISTAPKFHPLGNLPHPNPFQVAAYENDFFTYAAADWTVTATGGGTTALTAGNGGRILQTTGASINDLQGNAKLPACLAFAAGQQFWFMWRGQVDSLLAVMQVGVQTGGTIQAPTDGVYFNKPSGSAVNLILRAASTSTTIAMTGLTVAAATDFFLAFYYDGRTITPSLHAWAGPVSALVGPTQGNYFNSESAYFTSQVAAGGANPVNSIANLPTANLSPAFSVLASTAVIRTMNTDYLMAVAEINR